MTHTLISDILRQIKQSGEFSASGTIDTALPGLYIEGVGDISLPLPPAQAEAIITHCEQAPYGRGEETIVDTSVRNVWQLSPNQVELRNPSWEKAIQKACGEISKTLGLGKDALHATLYKALLYRTGCFFLPHRDTEKERNMCATLVVCLPSAHTGGELIISHGTQSHTYSFAGMHFQPEYVAFYADCLHEVKPVLSGYRFCLVYNLCVTRKRHQPAFEDYLQTKKQLEAELTKWSHSPGDPPILAYVLDHAYTQENLSLTNLKNKDFVHASALLEAAATSGCRASLCLVSYYEHGYGEYSGGYHHWDEDEECDEDNYTEYEISETGIYAHHLVDQEASTFPLEHLTLTEEQLIAEIPLTDGPGRESSISEATGNAGATRELWYTRAAVIFWPEKYDAEVAAESDARFAFGYLMQWISRGGLHNPQERPQLLKYARRILEDREHTSLMPVRDITSIFCETGDLELVKLHYHLYFSSSPSPLYTYSHSSDRNQCLSMLIDRFSFASLRAEIEQAIADRHKESPSYDALSWLCSLMDKKGSEIVKKPVVHYLEKCLEQSSQLINSASIEQLCTLMDTVSRLGTAEHVATLLKGFEGCSTGFLHNRYGPALNHALDREPESTDKKKTHRPSYLKPFLEDFCRQANHHYPQPPQPYPDLIRPGQLRCDCKLCQATNLFAKDPNSFSCEFSKQLKRDLVHLEESIKKAKIDLTLTTLPRPLPPSQASSLKQTTSTAKPSRYLRISTDGAANFVSEMAHKPISRGAASAAPT